MTRVDFYVLQAATAQARYALACRLLDKAIKGQHQIVVALDSAEQQQQVEHELLNFRPETYLPFRSSTDEDCGEPIVLDTQADNSHHDILLCLSQKLPDNFSQYQRVIEIVTQDEPALSSTREHWAFFKDRGYPVHHHAL